MCIADIEKFMPSCPCTNLRMMMMIHNLDLKQRFLFKLVFEYSLIILERTCTKSSNPEHKSHKRFYLKDLESIHTKNLSKTKYLCCSDHPLPLVQVVKSGAQFTAHNTQGARPKTFLKGLTNPFQHKIAFHQALIWLIFIDCY